jgi:hypothetical protein
MIGSVWGAFGIGRTSATSQGLFNVTQYTNRNAAVAMRIEPGASFFSFVR